MYGVSQLAKSEDLKFFYKGMTYAYGITESGNEVIALIDQNNGDYIDILSGSHKIVKRSSENGRKINCIVSLNINYFVTIHKISCIIIV